MKNVGRVILSIIKALKNKLVVSYNPGNLFDFSGFLSEIVESAIMAQLVLGKVLYFAENNFVLF